MLAVVSVLLFAYEIGANPYINPTTGTIQLCDAVHPCPSGYKCMYGSIFNAVQGCYMDNYAGMDRSGACPSNGITNVHIITCTVDTTCPGIMKCCYVRPLYGPSMFICMSPTTVQAQAQAQQNQVPRVTILTLGTADQTPDHKFIFNGTTALIQSKGKNVIFDTGTSTQKIDIITQLKYEGLTLNDIDMAILSHGHPDHSSNQNLWPDKPINFDSFVATGSYYGANPFGAKQKYYLFNDTNLELIKTPGHTMQDTSLIVRNVPNYGTVALVGDIFLNENDEQMWRGFSIDAELAGKSRKVVACLADYIYPGHGSMFEVSQQLKQSSGC